jgi:LysM repeat protein
LIMAMQNISLITVHYTATYEDQDIGVREIRKMHLDRGWRDIGYHLVLRLDGTVEKGRPMHQVGAHVAGRNSGNIGICYVGGLKRETGTSVGHNTMTKAQERALIRGIRALMKKHPNAQVVGHRDLAATQCPGFDVPAWWARVNATAVPKEKPAPADAPVKTPGVAEDDYRIVEKGDTWWSISREHGIDLAALYHRNSVTGPDTLPIGSKVRLAPVKDSLTADDDATSLWQALYKWLRAWFGGKP